MLLWNVILLSRLACQWPRGARYLHLHARYFTSVCKKSLPGSGEKSLRMWYPKKQPILSQLAFVVCFSCLLGNGIVTHTWIYYTYRVNVNSICSPIKNSRRVHIPEASAVPKKKKSLRLSDEQRGRSRNKFRYFSGRRAPAVERVDEARPMSTHPKLPPCLPSTTARFAKAHVSRRLAYY